MWCRLGQLTGRHPGVEAALRRGDQPKSLCCRIRDGRQPWHEHRDGRGAGTARQHYDLAIASARESGDPLLVAYMTGSLATFAAHLGDGPESLGLVASARQRLGPERPAIADAWLGAVAAYRLACAVRLGRPDMALTAAQHAAPQLTGSTKQVALWRLDHAAAHLQAGDLDQAFTIASSVLEATRHQPSTRVVEQARALRRQCNGQATTPAALAFDEHLQAIGA